MTMRMVLVDMGTSRLGTARSERRAKTLRQGGRARGMPIDRLRKVLVFQRCSRSEGAVGRSRTFPGVRRCEAARRLRVMTGVTVGLSR